MCQATPDFFGSLLVGGILDNDAIARDTLELELAPEGNLVHDLFDRTLLDTFVLPNGLVLGVIFR